MQKINVYIVGAGPGDVGLLTLRAKEVIENSEIVIYDRLIGQGVLSLIPENCERIFVGKIPGKNLISQMEIQNLIIHYAKTGKKVVRLKGGDPFLFGRGGEEAEFLKKSGIPFEVVPGISSALAVPEYAGISVTHRDFCSGINIFTAHKKEKSNDKLILQQPTKIFLMGVSQAEYLCENLISSGINPDIQCAVIENGASARQRILKSKLKNLAKKIKSENINPPAVIVVGEVTSLNLEWRENLNLSSKRIVITRPLKRTENLSKMLRDSGAEVILLPCIKTEIIEDSLNDVKISGYDWVAFTSVTGVEAFFDLLKKNNRDVRELGNSKIASIGNATSESLRSHGLKVDFVPEIFDSKNLAEGIINLGGNNILFFRAENGSKDISEVLRNRKVKFDEICIYKISYVKLNYIPEDFDIIIFTSSSTVRGFVQGTDKFKEKIAVCIGEQTANEAFSNGFKKIVKAEHATEQSIFDAVMSCSCS